MADTNADGEVLIHLDRELFEPATGDPAVQDVQAPDSGNSAAHSAPNSSAAQPAVDGHASPSTSTSAPSSGDAGQSSDGVPVFIVLWWFLFRL